MSVIQSILNHSNFLICNCRRSSFLWNVLAKQTVEVFIATAFPAGKWSGKVGSALKLFINKGTLTTPLTEPPCSYVVASGLWLTLEILEADAEVSVEPTSNQTNRVLTLSDCRAAPPAATARQNRRWWCFLERIAGLRTQTGSLKSALFILFL